MCRQIKTESDAHAPPAHRGLRPTFVAIIDALRSLPATYTTARHLHVELVRQHRPMPMQAIYRCLHSVERKGIVIRERTTTRLASRGRYALAARHGAPDCCQFYCRCCGRSVDVTDGALTGVLQAHARLFDFLPFTEALRIDALCIQCSHFSEIAPLPRRQAHGPG